MKRSRLDITKLPEGGYHLRARGANFSRIFLLCMSSVYFLLCAGGAIVFSFVVKELPGMILFTVMACFCGAGIVFSLVAEDFTITPWRLDEDGVTVCYRRKKPVILRWSEIKDWGFSYWGYVKYHGVAYRFYFSADAMQMRNSKTKKFPRKFRGVAMAVYMEDTEALRNSGLIPYCRAHLDGDDEAYVPMFRSDYPLNGAINRYGAIDR